MVTLRNPDPLLDRIETAFDRQPFSALLGMRLVLVEPGHVVVEMAPQPQLTQQHGALHAGATSSLVDTAAGFSALTLMPEGADVMSVEFKVNLMAPGKGTLFRADARVLRAGRTITTVEARAQALQADGQWLDYASFLGTMICLRPKAA
ncbi:PaaI family thioesterase [Zavarzinia compransoris]|uniref:PaaI family thioesterase n=1 Tax=Zavarzinia marina TaxID=2911065 RepID=UPI001F1BA807|nr:PaaI family thioesterase [Zavarzinia marina]MCF4164354.1 PaaI family thioesterase [Zavarzinia marina]